MSAKAVGLPSKETLILPFVLVTTSMLNILASTVLGPQDVAFPQSPPS
jgi:hypothetical protein